MAYRGSLLLFPRPKEDEVQVWTIRVSQFEPDILCLSSILDPQEKEKAGRFRREEDRKRYVVARGILRQLLGGYLAAAPDRLEFAENDFGKPALVQRTGDQPLAFNLAHSGDVVVYGVTNGLRVGVDVEAIRDDLQVMELAKGQFSAHELAALQAVSEPERLAAFFRCWTRKEAYLKARGEGLGFPLDRFSVTFGADESPAVNWAADDPFVTERWSMFDLPVAPGYAGAAVVEARPAKIVPCFWPPWA